ncbi:MAG: hypothetical protein F6K50_34020 [Moorea sp. SIO3I7]|nr:hypothetical protein [Moorena sp. SIO3I7]
MIKNPFKLEKLKIRVYKDGKRTGKGEDTFEVMFNPESYSLQYGNVYQKKQGLNTSGRVKTGSIVVSEKSLSLKRMGRHGY